MPAYFYHLTFELALISDLPANQTQPYTPPPNLDLFCSALPGHEISTWTSYLAPRAHRRSKSGSADPEIRPRLVRTRSAAEAKFHQDRRGLTKPTIETSPFVDKARQEPISSADAGDYRFGQLFVESIDMDAHTTNALESRQIANAKAATLESAAIGVPSLRGRYIPSEPKTTELGWGVVHLYRDVQEFDDLGPTTPSAESVGNVCSEEAYVDEECTTLCILAVPSYMTPSDLLGWFGSETQEMASHFRLVKTNRSNRYMVLLKFRESLTARTWQRAWNGKLFNVTEPENCHVVFVKSIRFDTKSAGLASASFPDMSNDPFTPVSKRIRAPPTTASSTTTVTTSIDDTSSQPSSSLPSKPAPPPTPALVELPTCPVCLERMDDTTGLATIFCQHVFHCACLQKWQGSGCPVCRYTQGDPIHRLRGHGQCAQRDQCRTCGSTSNLWICLICGQVGCGRYDEAHAYAHFEQTSHVFAMDLETQVIWDYVGDEYVHRLIQNKADGKLLELPSAVGKKNEVLDEDDPIADKAKLDNMSLEYANLLKGQLDSQRSYFEEQVDRAVDKAAKASMAADHATAASLKANERLEAMQASHQILLNETLPGLEKEKERAKQRCEKFEGMARKLEKEWKEGEVINESLMDRIGHLERQLNEMTLKNSDLEEQNRDLSFFISGMEKLKDQGSDIQEGMLSVGDAPTPGKKKKKAGKGKT